jgi:hypothetical protein
MDLQNNHRILGLPAGVLYGQQDRTEELNQRMSSRNFADAPLEPNYDPRPVSTKYSLFPIADRRPVQVEPPPTYATYNMAMQFNPGSDRAPSSGYRNNVDVETILRNQTFALQHGATQSVYIPSSKSDLYNNTIVSTPGVPQPHPELFTQPQFSHSVHPNVAGQEIGNNRFFNHTRTQLRGL